MSPHIHIRPYNILYLVIRDCDDEIFLKYLLYLTKISFNFNLNYKFQNKKNINYKNIKYI